MCLARFSFTSLCRGTGREIAFGDCDTSRASPRGELVSTLVFPACESGPSASSDGKFSDSADARDLAAGQVPKEITEILLQVRKRLALGQVVGELFKIAEPHAAILPVDVTGRVHDIILPLHCASTTRPGAGWGGGAPEVRTRAMMARAAR